MLPFMLIAALLPFQTDRKSAGDRRSPISAQADTLPDLTFTLRCATTAIRLTLPITFTNKIRFKPLLFAAVLAV